MTWGTGSFWHLSWRPRSGGTGRREPPSLLRSTDHKNLAYLRSAKRLNPRQARWALFLARFNFTITYRPGTRNTKPDVPLSPILSGGAGGTARNHHSPYLHRGSSYLVGGGAGAGGAPQRHSPGGSTPRTLSLSQSRLA